MQTNTRTLWTATLATALFGGVLPSGLAAQHVLFEAVADDVGDFLGFSVDAAGDVDQDGFPDVIVGAPQPCSSASCLGYVRVFSGMDGSLVYEVVGEDQFDRVGHSVAGAGDVNGDGADDVIVGVPGCDEGPLSNAGAAWVLSGLDGSLIHNILGDQGHEELGWSVSGAGDVNNDGYADVVAGAPFADTDSNRVGWIIVVSGADGAELYRKRGAQSQGELGRSVSGAGDVNNDGYDDFMGGAPFAGNKGRVLVYSGLDGQILWEESGDEEHERYGWSVSGAGDVNADGYDDFVVGSPRFGADEGRVNVYSGFDGSELHAYVGMPGDWLGTSVSGAGDVNADGYADFVAGGQSGFAHVYSGFDGSQLALLRGPTGTEPIGEAVAGAGDLNLDGRADIIVGSHSEGFVGVARVFNSACSVATYCSTVPNSAGTGAFLSSFGGASLSDDNLHLNVFGAPAGTPGLFFYGSGFTEVPFGDGVRCVDGEFVRLDPLMTDGSGKATQSVALQPTARAGLFAAGSTWYFQFWFRDVAAGGAGFNLSNGLRATICN